MKIESRAQSCPKDSNEPERPNEDALRQDKSRGIYAVSDGAGGTGIFSDLWANYLVSHLPAKPIFSLSELNQWIDTIWESFYREREQALENLAYPIRNKFHEQGSAATLAALWLEGEKAHLLTYGDSHIWSFKSDDYTQKLFIPYKKTEDFEANPYLLNWKDENLSEKGFCIKSIELAQNQILILATDALSLYLMQHYERNYEKDEKQIEVRGKIRLTHEEINKSKAQNFDEILKNLWNVLESEEKFSEFCREAYQKGQLLNDDYSLIFIKIS
ncbi:protein phosphatase 2C domain-containing protein [Hugenholtzia roseola]|uniref:protein phosphatase 2C domain-containing protein n=1 Tax=Hugenholtzia roseola TaxID=1002 RepID=UPI00040CAB11|nr:PP2C family serine/threonine-protein phosphatase [Hugenholtzia roseola]